MFIHYRTPAFILKKKEEGEANQWLIIYSKHFGKLEILGRGIRKISSKLKSSVEIFSFSEIEFIQGKRYKTLTDAILIKKFKNLRNDLSRLKIAFKVSEVLDKLITAPEEELKIWELIKKTFEDLDDPKIKNKKLVNLYFYFLWNFFSLLGYQPELYHCLSCQRKILEEKSYFEIKMGGLICQKCFFKVKSGTEIDIEIIKTLRTILKKERSLFFRLKIEKKHALALKEISQQYYSFILG